MLPSVSRSEPKPKESKNQFYFCAFGGPPRRRVFGNLVHLTDTDCPIAVLSVTLLLSTTTTKREGFALNNKADISSETVLKIVVSWVVTSIVL
jgi:hypothetical protein